MGKGEEENGRICFFKKRSSPPEVLIKRCFENMQQIYRRTPLPKCDFNRVAYATLL